MPMVGKKEYAYTAKGMAMAKKDAKKTGKRMVMRKSPKKMSMMKKTGKKK
jgi:aminoglycoside phosphotransferase (APT) family kinase protein